MICVLPLPALSSVRNFAASTVNRRGRTMNIRRRGFLAGLAATSLVPITARGMVAPDVVAATPPQPAPLLPDALHKGSRIGIACPASGVTRRELQEFEVFCNTHGFTMVLGRNVARNNGYLSAPDKDRADEFMELTDNPQVDAIVCARGGYGVMRILPMLDFGAIGQARKPIIGFSDITALLIAANQMANMVTYHGPVATSTFDEFTLSCLRSVLFEGGHDTSAPFTFSDKRLTVINDGLGRGRLTGGNLAMVAATLGTRYEIDTRGAILFMEEINEEPYKIDRMLTQLWLAGKLQTAAGIALGNFKNCEAKSQSITEPSFTLKQVLDDRLKDLGIPVVYGLPFGHVRSKLTLPLGIMAELDATNKTLRILKDAVA